MTNRRLARESALEVLYRLDLVGDEPENTISEILLRKNPSDEAETYLRRLVDAALGRQQETDAVLRRHLTRWRLERLTVLDRAILRLAAAEILYFDDVPPKVSINEAVEIAKKYGDDEAGKFVNGVLDGVFQESDPSH
ncbi:transcription antitermination factor NusB [candidate division WOR-3 bacterium]|uniref:Transcription antitermination protein NusB n=1 Tax=candidate division WOR-3 bacterium TaxID=2052148 RepID=A0A937XI70_UNCW3|nr:transcription antitermination factor NusB [candidate division WOR-3 bacterium]